MPNIWSFVGDYFYIGVALGYLFSFLVAIFLTVKGAKRYSKNRGRGGGSD